MIQRLIYYNYQIKLLFKIVIKILYIFYILFNKLMDFMKKELSLLEKNYFDIISCIFFFRVQMIYGDNDILVYYVYSNSGCECVMIYFFLVKLVVYEI